VLAVVVLTGPGGGAKGSSGGSGGAAALAGAGISVCQEWRLKVAPKGRPSTAGGRGGSDGGSSRGALQLCGPRVQVCSSHESCASGVFHGLFCAALPLKQRAWCGFSCWVVVGGHVDSSQRLVER